LLASHAASLHDAAAGDSLAAMLHNVAAGKSSQDEPTVTLHDAASGG